MTGSAGVDPLYLGYVVAFGLAAVACFGSIARMRHVEDPDTRRGLVWLLALSGAWATAHVAFLVAPTTELRVGAYMVGLVVGFATVGPWLYFCSAYTGRSLHRNATVQWAAVAAYLAITAVKLTNPFHRLYFTADVATVPFPHLAINNGPFHWLAMGLAYALATVGYFMLVELFWQVGRDTKPLLVLVGLTGLPVVLDVVGAASPLFLDITYEPLGVAAFAVGVVFLYLDDFRSIQLAGERDDPVVVLDDDDRVRDYNRAAADLFPALTTDAAIEGIVPELAGSLDGEDGVVGIERTGGTRYYQLSTNPFTTGGTRTGQVVLLTDVTHRERYRAELERQNERLEQFASMVSHDLRNPLNVAMARVDLERDERESEHLETASQALDRMEELIEDVLTLARQGQPISDTERVSLSAIADRSWEVVDTKEATLTVERDLQFRADPDRLQQLLENLFRNAIDHGRDDIAVTVGALDDDAGFYVADDGPGIPADERDQVFESGYSTATDGTGFGLAIVGEIAEAHGWEIEVTESADGGARFEVTVE